MPNTVWWKEEAEATQARPLVHTHLETPPVAVAEESVSLWDELEAGARARAATEALHESQSLTIPFAKEQAARRLRKRAIWKLVGLSTIAICMTLHAQESGHGWVPSFLGGMAMAYTALIALAWVLRESRLRRHELPVLILTPEGIQIHTLHQDFGLLRWNEIAEIHPHKSLYRSIRIVRTDRGAPIDVPLEYIGLSEDAVMARIGAYQSEYGGKRTS